MYHTKNRQPIHCYDFIKKLIGLLLGVWFFLLGSMSLAWAQAYQYEVAPGTAINNNSCTNTSIAVTDNFTITDLNVGIVLSHTYRGDLEINLVSPLGTTVRLYNRHGTSRDNLNVLLDDSASTNVSSMASTNHSVGTPYYNSNFRPYAALSGYNNTSANGNWTVQVCDRTSSNTGTVNRLQLRFQGNPLSTTAGCSASLSDSYFYNPAFESYSALPTDWSYPWSSQLDRLNNWDQVTEGTTDFLHDLGTFNNTSNEVVGSSTHLRPYSSTASSGGAVGFLTSTDSDYAEYVGQCLKTPLAAGKKYRLRMRIGYPDNTKSETGGDISGALIALGRSSCPTSIPLAGSGNKEGQPGYTLLGETSVNHQWEDGWHLIEIDLSPATNMPYVMFGLRKNNLIGEKHLVYAIVDELVLNESKCVPSLAPSPQDFGDAPLSYGVASQNLSSDLYLGDKAPDAELARPVVNAANGNEQPGAFGDDMTAVDDDELDGIYGTNYKALPLLVENASSYSLTLPLRNSTGAAAKLLGWIDYNKNGVFETAEGASVNVAANATSATLQWSSIPANRKAGTTYLRLVLTADTSRTLSQASLEATNAGEVEDYPIGIATNTVASQGELSVRRLDAAPTCASPVFFDDFNTGLWGNYWGPNREDPDPASPITIPNWVATGSGSDTYAAGYNVGGTNFAVYFGMASVRRMYPENTVFQFDSNGLVLNPPQAIEVRDKADDITPGETGNGNDFGGVPLTLSRTFNTTVGQTYHLTFEVFSEFEANAGEPVASGIVGVKVKGATTRVIHLETPDMVGGKYHAVKFVADSTQTTVTFINYGHFESDYGSNCVPHLMRGCTLGGGQYGNGTGNPNYTTELIIDNVSVVADSCGLPFGGISGVVYKDANENDMYDSATESGLSGIRVSVYDDKGTVSTSDDALVTSTNSGAGGVYSFSELATTKTYRIQVDTLDFDLPEGASISTTNPLVGVSITAGGVTTDQNFGFNLPADEYIYTPPTYNVCKSTSVEQIDAFQYNVVTGAGSNGIPSLTYTPPPPGANRMMVALLTIERDHTPTNVRGDNLEANYTVGGSTSSLPDVYFGGKQMKRVTYMINGLGNGGNFENFEISRSQYLYTLTDTEIPSGTQTLTVQNINAPKGIGDEAILAVATFGNVAAVDVMLPVAVKEDQTAPYQIDLSAMAHRPTGQGQPPGTTSADNLLFAFGSSSAPERLRIGSTWSLLAQIPVFNSKGEYGVASGLSQGTFTEDDGHVLIAQSIKGVTGTQHAELLSSSESLAGIGLMVVRFVAYGCDYGDAPSSYGDAYHAQDWARNIGPLDNDSEAASSNSAPYATTATGDDSQGLDDEDGITIPSLEAGQSATITVAVRGPSTTATYLSAWIDWNGNGSFDTSEKIATDLQDSDSDGVITIPISVPSDATASPTFARFRWSMASGVGPTGYGSYGEVEDHRLTITTAVPVCSLVVTTTSDTNNSANNSGSLRDAIECANSHPGPDTITFNMATSQSGYTASTGVWTIKPTSALPTLTDGDTTIDGVSQTGSQCTIGSRKIVVELDGSSAGSVNAGLSVHAPNILIKGMAINNFSGAGVHFYSDASRISDGSAVKCSNIGINAAGTTAKSNTDNGVVVKYANSIIVGGSNTSDRNLIGGNKRSGIFAEGTSDLLVENNYIGLNAPGTAAIANGTGTDWSKSGIDIAAFLRTSTRPTIRNNVISGNTEHGLVLTDTSHAVVVGNTIGLNATGTAAIPNGSPNAAGLYLKASSHITIGGGQVSDRNIISGNNGNGILFNNSGSIDDVVIQGNYIGVGSNGITDLPNKVVSGVTESGAAIGLYNATNITIGGSLAGQGNIINSECCGIIAYGAANGSIKGNIIGSTVNKNAILDFTASAVELRYDSNNWVIGGTTANEGNLIVGAKGSASGGVVLDGVTGITVQGNQIGVLPDGTPGQNTNNIYALNSARSIKIGGTTSAEANTLAHATSHGVLLTSSSVTPPTQVVILGNSIYNNADHGIDLGEDGVTANDAGDADTGANYHLNYPTFVLGDTTGGNLALTYRLDVPAGTYRVEFFDNPEGADSSGHGEGKVFLGAQSITHDGTGTKTFTTTLNSVTVADVMRVSATVSLESSAGNYAYTSEFSAWEAASIKGRVFEDINYGGGAGRDYGTSGTAGTGNTRLELYNTAGQLVAITNTAADGTYTFANVFSGNYFVRVVNQSVRSTRTGSNGTERGISTFRHTGSAAVTNEIGGRNPAVVDAGYYAAGAVLDTTNFTFSGAMMDGQVAQTITPLTVSAGNITGVDFGFNFDTIVNTLDSGQGSLRQFILNANLLSNAGLAQAGFTAGVETSIFQIPGAGPHAIYVNSALPSLNTASTALDATTQAGASCAPASRSIKVGLYGDHVGANVNGLTLDNSNLVIRGLAIGRFTEMGLYGTGNADNLKVACNNFGLEADGMTAAKNGLHGIHINGASDVIIGGSSDNDRNIISNNTRHGALFANVKTITVERNYVGTNAAGDAARSNNQEAASYAGLAFATKTDNITIRNNLVSGNDIIGTTTTNKSRGIDLNDITNATIIGNQVGTNPAGTAALGNSGYGIYMLNAKTVRIGGTVLAERNIISGNGLDGISGNFGTNTLSILGNYIGVDINGTTAMGNGGGNSGTAYGNGIFLNQASVVTIGNGTAEGRNIVSNNAISGIRNSQTPGTLIRGNYVGLNATGNGVHGNLLHGIYVQNSANVVIGGTNAGDRNIISNNRAIGIFITDAASNTAIRNNIVGLMVDGTTAAGNRQSGIEYRQATGVIVDGNIIAANLTRGIHADRSLNTTITNNKIGVNEAGDTARGNNTVGIDINTAGAGLLITNNQIAANGASGIRVINGDATGGYILTNTLGLNAAGTGILPNGQDGILVDNTPGLSIGNATSAGRNIISGNTRHGIYINGTSATGVSVLGNWLGVSTFGTGGGLGNAELGIYVKEATNVAIGNGTEEGTNLIAYSGGAGIALTADVSQSFIKRNNLYANAGLGIDLNNDQVTLNDAGDPDTGPNGLLNFPVLKEIQLLNGDLRVLGCAPTGSTVELYEADVSPNNKAARGSNRFGRKKDYGEGHLFLASFVEGSAQDADSAACSLGSDADGNNFNGLSAFSLTIPAPASVEQWDLLTATATLASTGTSEFGATQAVMGLANACPAGESRVPIKDKTGWVVTVPSNGYEGNGALLIDDKTDTRWVSHLPGPLATNTNIILDLGSVTEVGGLWYYTRTNDIDGTLVNYQIEVSNDNVTYTSVATGYLESTDRMPRYIGFDQQNTRYIKLTALDTTGGTYIDVTELVPVTCAEVSYPQPLSVAQCHSFDYFHTGHDPATGGIMPLNTFDKKWLYAPLPTGTTDTVSAIDAVPSWTYSLMSGDVTGYKAGSSITNWHNGFSSIADWISNVDGGWHLQTGAIDSLYRKDFEVDLSDPFLTHLVTNLELDFYVDNAVWDIVVNGTSLKSLPEFAGQLPNSGAADPYYYLGYVETNGAHITIPRSLLVNGKNNLVVHLKSGPEQQGFFAETRMNIACLGIDLSDAPASYGQASHTHSNDTHYLGAAVPDSDTAILDSSNADGDDNNGNDDEDGIAIPKSLPTGTSVSLTATVAGAAGYLNAWIDWNADGDFNDAGEQVAQNLQDNGASDTNNASGTLSWPVAIPASATLGNTFARFRWSSEADLSPTGLANDGEVEDYAVKVDRIPNIGQTTTCSIDGGTDVLFLLDNSGSIDPAEYSGFANQVQAVGQALKSANPAIRMAVAHYSGLLGADFGQHLYLERDFATTAPAKPIRQFFTGAFDSTQTYSADNLAGATYQLTYVLDDNAATSSSYVVSSLKELARDVTKPLQIIVFTDAHRYDNSSSALIDLAGTGFEPNDGSNFTIYNKLKEQGVFFSVVAFTTGDNTEDTVRDPAAAAIASLGGAYSGAVEANAHDPDGSGTQPRRYIRGAVDFTLTPAQVTEVVTSTAAICPTDPLHSIAGHVFEDVNYGGGAGRPLSTAATAGVSGATVELYSSTGGFITSTVTAADGSYQFPDLDGTVYFVRVVNDTVSSTRPGANGSEVGVQTFLSNGEFDVTNKVGGENPAVADAPANTTNQTLNTSSYVLSGGGQAQSIQSIMLKPNSATGVDFGFNFDTIVNTNSDGQGSLRQFILNSNRLQNTGLAQSGLTAGKEHSIFMLPTTDPNYTAATGWVIKPSSALQAITAAGTVLDASLQSGTQCEVASRAIVVTLDGSLAGANINGLTIQAADTTVRGLTINQFTNSGILTTPDADNLTLLCNHIGTDRLGNTAAANGWYGVILDGVNTATIGNATSSGRNIISGNVLSGVYATNDAANVTLLGNHIGVNFAGDAAIANHYFGVDIEGGSNFVVGNNAANGRNILSGNDWSGLNINDTQGISIRGNYMGLNASGTAALGNGKTGPSNTVTGDGVSVGGAVSGLVIENNVMSGHSEGDSPNGLEFFNVITDGAIIRNNIFGLNAAGTAALGNLWHGFQIAGGKVTSSVTNILIEGNTFAANTRSGLFLNGTVKSGQVVANRMGTAVDGITVLGNTQYGIYLGTSNGGATGPTNLSIGDGTAAKQNIIAGNLRDGVLIMDSANLNVNNNKIGLVTNSTAAGNQGTGIKVVTSQNVQIQNNAIAHNTSHGISIETGSLGVVASRNNLYANTGLGINLGTTGVTINDANDSDTGPNNLLNLPQFNQVLVSGSNLVLSGCAPTGSTIELFEADVSPSSTSGVTAGANQFGLSQDYGEGERYIATFVEGVSEDSVTTPINCATVTNTDGHNATGMSPFQWTMALPADVVVGDKLTATAKVNNVGTSEFSSVNTVVKPADYGDAPASYGTPSHTIVAGVYMGTTAPDIDSGPAHTNNAAGDDLLGTDDEDGFALSTFFHGQVVQLNTTVSGAGGRLQAWIDWNHDGDFADAGEQVATNLTDNGALDQNPATGQIRFAVSVPATANVGLSFARFRWSSQTNLDATSPAVDGEVEDYRVSISYGSCDANLVADFNVFGAATVNAQNEIVLTPDVFNTSGVAWSKRRINLLQPFTLQYSVYLGTKDAPGADGVVFAFHNAPGGSSAIGLFGGALGVGKMTPAIAVEFDTYDNTPVEGTSFMDIANDHTVIYNPVNYDNLIGGGASSLYSPVIDLGNIEDGQWHTIQIIWDPVAKQLTYSFDGITRHTLNRDVVNLDFAGNPFVHYGFAAGTGASANEHKACLISAPPVFDVDFSDAPATYGLPAHLIAAGIHLGAVAPDSETTAQPDGFATGDDKTGIDDEDGITFPDFGLGQTVEVSAAVQGAGGRLQAWIDWNVDGDFNDVGEKIATDIADNAALDTNPTAGVIKFAVNVPATAVVGQTFARFRWSTQAGVGFDGIAIDGEVEDYVVTVKPAMKLSGMVFEDVNYGGGLGRSRAAANGIGINGVTVELYNSTGALVKTTTTANDGTNNGMYLFDEMAGGNYYVRVVNDTVNSTRGGSNGTELGVQTFRTDGASPVTNKVGGQKPALVDAGANTTTRTLDTSNFVLSGAVPNQVQSIQPVVLSNADKEGVDFGFNFSTVVNANDSGQGSLRQFIANNNLLASTTVSQILPASIASDYTAGDSVSIFMIPVADLVTGEAKIPLTTALDVNRAKTKLDGRTQAANMGSGVIVIDGVANTTNRNAINIGANADSSAVKYLTIRNMGGSAVALNGTSTNTSRYSVIEGNTFTHNGYATANKAGLYANYLQDGRIANNTITTSNGAGMQFEHDLTTSVVTDNTVTANVNEGLWIKGGSANNTFTGNTIRDNGTVGVLVVDASQNTFTGNTVSNNGAHGLQLTGSSSTWTVQTNLISNNANHGVFLQNTAANHQVLQNTIHNNTWAGISHSGTGANNSYLQNSITGNGTLGIDLNTDGVTSNDKGDTDNGPNTLQNYGGTEANSFGSNGTKVVTYSLVLDLLAGDYRIEFYMSADKDSSGHGEGETYIGYVDMTHPGTGEDKFFGTFNAVVSVPEDAWISSTVTRKTGATSFGSTSEFSGTIAGSETHVCTDLTEGSGGDITIDENVPVITLLKSVDKDGNPINYVISGGVDGPMFYIEGPDPADPTFDCAKLRFIGQDGINLAEPVTEEDENIAQADSFIFPGNYERPANVDGNNIYKLEITATDSAGNTVTRQVNVTVADVNEKPTIISTARASMKEGETLAQLVKGYDADANDAISFALYGGADQALFTLDRTTGELHFIQAPDYENPADHNHDNIYEVEVSVTDRMGYMGTKALKITIINDTSDDGVVLSVRALLQGAYDASSLLMRDNLREKGVLPVAQPYNAKPFNYAGSEQINLDLVDIANENAMVDWVLLELRSADDPKLIVARKALLVQRDGDLMDAGTSYTLHSMAGIKEGNYYVSVRHRNHLGVMTATPIPLSAKPTVIDFSVATTPLYGADASVVKDKISLMWAGDLDQNNQIYMFGAGNDLNPIFSAVLRAEANTGLNTNHGAEGYLPTDLNLDGVTLFTGPNNDTTMLLRNMYLHPKNTTQVTNYVIRGGLPQ